MNETRAFVELWDETEQRTVVRDWIVSEEDETPRMGHRARLLAILARVFRFQYGVIIHRRGATHLCLYLLWPDRFGVMLSRHHLPQASRYAA